MMTQKRPRPDPQTARIIEETRQTLATDLAAILADDPTDPASQPAPTGPTGQYAALFRPGQDDPKGYTLKERLEQKATSLYWKWERHDLDQDEITARLTLAVIERINRDPACVNRPYWHLTTKATWELDNGRAGVSTETKRADWHESLETIDATDPARLMTGPDTVLDQVCANTDLNRAMVELDPADRDAFLLAYLAGMKRAQVCETLGHTNTRQTAHHLRKATVALRQTLANYAPDRPASQPDGQPETNPDHLIECLIVAGILPDPTGPGPDHALAYTECPLTWPQPAPTHAKHWQNSGPDLAWLMDTEDLTDPGPVVTDAPTRPTLITLASPKTLADRETLADLADRDPHLAGLIATGSLDPQPWHLDTATALAEDRPDLETWPYQPHDRDWTTHNQINQTAPPAPIRLPALPRQTLKWYEDPSTMPQVWQDPDHGQPTAAPFWLPRFLAGPVGFAKMRTQPLPDPAPARDWLAPVPAPVSPVTHLAPDYYQNRLIKDLINAGTLAPPNVDPTSWNLDYPTGHIDPKDRRPTGHNRRPARPAGLTSAELARKREEDRRSLVWLMTWLDQTDPHLT